MMDCDPEDEVLDQTLGALSSGGKCVRKTYFVYTHVCTIDLHARAHDTDHCCCAHNDRVFCCKYHQAGNIYRCNESDDVIDVVARASALVSWEVLLPVVLVSVFILGCFVYCCCCKRHCCVDHDSATEAECGCCTQSDTDDETGKIGAQEEKTDELLPLNSGGQLLPASVFGNCYPTYPVLQEAPCPHCGHPPLSAIQPSAPPAEDVGSGPDQGGPTESAPMSRRVNSDVTGFGDRDPAHSRYSRSNSVPATHLVHSYTCPSCPIAAVAPPSYDDSHRDRIVA
ncbi:hypothetical protein LSAT2_008178 [Lamellibrachia satsuma]|nr:hypothetical protein LSAT2_008178 [Lamellibrachia satsuma]